MAHHDSNAKRALEEFVALDEAIGLANKIVDPEDTLVVVTADHSHEFVHTKKKIKNVYLIF